MRNVAKRTGKSFVKAYAHNDWFYSMESIVHFYNTAYIPHPRSVIFDIVHQNQAVIRHNIFISQVTRLPATYNECSRIFTEAVVSDEWLDICLDRRARSPQTTNGPLSRP